MFRDLLIFYALHYYLLFIILLLIILSFIISRPPSQFFTIRTSQPANNIYIVFYSLTKLENDR